MSNLSLEQIKSKLKQEIERIVSENYTLSEELRIERKKKRFYIILKGGPRDGLMFNDSNSLDKIFAICPLKLVEIYYLKTDKVEVIGSDVFHVYDYAGYVNPKYND